ncbi:putative WD40/YVTN repeat-like-containing domain superfamily [Helianthus debilis subsp. tardiflorus]
MIFLWNRVHMEGIFLIQNLPTAALMERIPSRWPRSVWHAPWKNYRVISGHLGWVRSVTLSPNNQWVLYRFCRSND